MQLYLNGEFTDAKRARIDPTDRGFTLADGVFDTLLAVDGQARDALDHFSRLARHAGRLALPLPENPAKLVDVARRLLEKNDFTKGRHAIRTTLTRGTAQRGIAMPDPISPTLVMRAGPAPQGSRKVRLATAKIRRNETSPLARVKSLNYLDNILALQDAVEGGFDDAVFLNSRGRVCCATAANIHVLVDGLCVTPPLEDGVLDGVVRARLLRAGLVRERSISARMLADAEAIYLSNSIAGIRRVIALDGFILSETVGGAIAEDALRRCIEGDADRDA